ncbi:MAG: hypothetical protein L0Y44_09715 [Phycisphaerales bacterium]|nr:hypothetical protein [Phycisphaerales bacterium]MCI0630914.1 hypothetical protein [Phycisphaerales bacterium]
MRRRSMLASALAAVGTLFGLGCASQSTISPGAMRGAAACCCCCCDPNCEPGCCAECPPDCKVQCTPGCCDDAKAAGCCAPQRT